jgi:hypothetical protein
MHPDFKPIPPSPGGWVTPDRVIEWERTTDTFAEFSPYFIYNNHKASIDKNHKSDWRKAATWLDTTGISDLKPLSEVQQSYKQQSESTALKKQSELTSQPIKRHHHTRSWSPQSTYNANQNVQYQPETETQCDILQNQFIYPPKRSAPLIGIEEFNNDHVVNSILKVVEDEPPPPQPITTVRAEGYYWYQLLQSNTENAFWNNLAIFTKTCNSNQLCTPFFFANFARTLMMHHASIHLVGIEMESWDLRGQQRKHYTAKPIYLPVMMHQDPMTAVAHLVGFPSTFEENMTRLREAGISSETRMILKSHFLL